ncbi:ceramidase domain-containing protein [Candidatus Nitronereus thalassa]|uniref:Ceramidase domain-containing protein n=1 Tax=Candidatus Nitronereus thalassa TaxID=3020898 RepID=A0ABU3K5C6_9BACT|nr:ceramidase domain-containing protein [Candidatus Nitronereus thalassa]MDT7041595.1 ceramidase domain-containing protein [Candidatus Nitronereus thalassa]
MWPRWNWRHGTLLGVVGLGLVLPFFLDRIPQDSLYHSFADSRPFVGIPNFLNVVSNVFFILVGIIGLLASHSRGGVSVSAHIGTAYKLFFGGVVLIGVGSAYYHVNPNNATLVWDRLPMTVSFMAFLTIVISDCVSPKVGKVLLWPLIGIGVVSIGYWYVTELWGVGDLRPYVVVQFLPIFLIPVMLILFGTRSLLAPFLWATLGTYLLAKVVEYFDGEIFFVTEVISGHSLKHVIAALAIAWVLLACQRIAPKCE